MTTHIPANAVVLGESGTALPAFALPFDMLWLLLALVSISVALLMLGRRGKRVGNQPHCANCNYNLQSIRSSHCPECGAPLAAYTATGLRRPRRIVLAIAVIPLLMGLSIGYAYLTRYLSQLDPARHYTFAMLMSDAEAGNAHAIGELWRRLSHDEMSEEQMHAFTDLTLTKIRQDLEWKRYQMWYRVLIHLRDTRRLIPEEVMRYFEFLLTTARAGSSAAPDALVKLEPLLSQEQLAQIVPVALKLGVHDSCARDRTHARLLPEIFLRSWHQDAADQWISTLQAISRRPPPTIHQEITDGILQMYETQPDPQVLDPHWLELLATTTQRLTERQREEVRRRLSSLAGRIATSDPGMFETLIDHVLVLEQALPTDEQDQLDELIYTSTRLTADRPGYVSVEVTAWLMPALSWDCRIGLEPVQVQKTGSHDVLLTFAPGSDPNAPELLPWTTDISLATRLYSPGDYDLTIDLRFDFYEHTEDGLSAAPPVLSKTIRRTETLTVE